jgi:predicted AAA+ superfamily ATPase
MDHDFILRSIQSELERLNKIYPVVVLTGPRQSGKTTLCKTVFAGYSYFDLDNVKLREQIAASPEAFLKQHAHGIIIDEAQQYPELFSYIKVLADEVPDCHFILSGSSNFALMAKVTESLSGRAATLTLLPLSLKELGDLAKSDTDTLLLRGGYPAVWSKKVPVQVLSQNYYNTYIERDVRQLLNIKDITKFQLFMKLCAGRVGSEINASALSGEVGLAVRTIQEWLSVLEASYIVFRLPPFYRNIGKRLVKASKIYFLDTALVCFFLGVENETQLATHPLRGAIFENYVVLEFLKERFNKGKTSNLFYYRDQSQREVDLLQEHGTQISAFEIKSAKGFSKDFFSNLSYLRKHLGKSLVSTQLIFDGNTEIESPENGSVNFRNVHMIRPFSPDQPTG